MFHGLFDVVIGSDVAATLGYKVGQDIVVSHGLESLVDHDDLPFVISGIIEKTGTPVDRSLFISLSALEAVHTDVSARREALGPDIPAEMLFRDVDLTPKFVTAALIGVRDKIQIFGLQRQINTYAAEPLTAILPGVTLSELWRVTGLAENVLRLIAWAVVLTALVGMIATVMAGLAARQREFAIFRTVGATPGHIVYLIIAEIMILVASAIFVSLGLSSLILVTAGSFANEQLGISLQRSSLQVDELPKLLLFLLFAPLAAILPAFAAYRSALSSQLARKTP